MAQLAMFVMAVFLIGQALADIIVQPGYEHSAQQRVATQPPETVRHSVQQDNQQQDRQQERYADPGPYHLELHPVYGNSYHVPSYAVLPIYSGTLPPMSKATYKRLLSSLGEITEVPSNLPPQYYQYNLPPAVHSRRKRSNGEKLDSAGQGNKHDENDVAAKPSLNDDAMSVVDLQNQDEKRVKARHSVTLLGLKPSNMRPVHQQYRTYDPQQMTGGQQTLSQANPQETSQQQQQQAAATPSQTSNPDAENVQRSIFLQDHLSQQPQQFRLEQRKFPELRPLSAGQSSPIVAKSDDHVAARTSMIPSGVNNEEIVGTKLGDIYKIKVIQNLHQHGRGRTTENTPKEDVSVNFINPGNNKGVNKNLATVQGGGEQAAVQTGAEQLVQVYQLPDELGVNYVQNPQYIVLPQTYPLNYVGNYVDNYASAVYPYTPLYSSYKICFESPDNLQQPIAYQLV